MIKEISGGVNEGQWLDLKPHEKRGALILVAPELDLVEVGLKMANDKVAAVEGWIEKQLIKKPTQEQIQFWNENPEKKFQFIIVQPYVLLQMSAH